MNPDASIIICTRNRAESLRETLTTVAACNLPSGLVVEVIVVNNASTDGTRAIVESADFPANMTLRYLHEPRPGKCFAYNFGLAHAQADLIVCTDDDIRVPTDWISGMCRPLQTGEADAVVGTIRMAPHLRRPWMQPEHCSWLACNEGIGEDHPSPDLVGANMAFTRHAVELAGGFDVELGPGRGMGGDDTLLSWRMKEAGLRIMRLAHPVVEHHFDAARLTRESFVRTAIRSGWNDAYLQHHWLHTTPHSPRWAVARAWLRLWYYRARRWHEWVGSTEGISVWEKGMVQELATARELILMKDNQRKYSRNRAPDIAESRCLA